MTIEERLAALAARRAEEVARGLADEAGGLDVVAVGNGVFRVELSAGQEFGTWDSPARPGLDRAVRKVTGHGA